MFDRYWLLTWTTYGTRLPGDSRGSVTSVRAGPGPRAEHDLPGTPVDGPMPGLEAAARAQMIGPPVYLTAAQAGQVLRAFQETTAYRGWGLVAAVMADHAHLVVGVPGDPDPAALVRDLKSYASRALNRRWGKPRGGTWWAGGGGSRRKLPDAEAVRAGVGYVRRQYRPLLVWTAEEGLIVGEAGLLGEGPPRADAPGSPD